MGLWLFYVDARDDEIEAACKAADQELKRRCVGAADAQQAAIDAAELPESYTAEFTPSSGAVAAWYAAEDAACKRLDEITGEWPHGAGLIYTEI